MSAPRALPPFIEKAIFLGLGVVAVEAALIPLGPGGALVAPDLLFGLVVAWVIRRPATAPFWAVVALGLFADLMMSRPLGLGALGLVLASEWFRRRAARFQARPFPLEWLAVTLAFAAMLAGMELALALVFADGPGFAALARYAVTTALAYPLIVLGLTWCLNLRAPAAPRGGAMKARRSEPAPRITRRGLMLLGLQAGVVGALGWRMRDLQIVQNEHFALLAEENRVNIRLIPPARGRILDRAGRLMAGNRQNYRISMVREQARDPEAVLARLGDDHPAAAPTCRSGR